MKPPVLSVIIPVFNEKAHIAEVVRRVEAAPVDKEVIIVDDASTDGTASVIENDVVPRCRNVKFIRHQRNGGKGRAIRTALGHVTGGIVLVQDGDLEYDPADYPRLIQPILEGRSQVVYGSRFLPKDQKILYWHHFFGVKALNLLANLLYDARITDESTCYKVIKTDLLKDIKLSCERFEFCPEITAKIRKKGHRILEVPIHYQPRSREQGKKLRWTDGFQAVWTLLKYRFTD